MEQRSGRLKRNFLLGIISFFGVGLVSKKMPGTIGSFFAACIFPFLPRDVFALLFVTIFLSILGAWACQCYVVKYGFESDRDPKYVVIDEVCGFFLAMSLSYLVCKLLSPLILLMNFVLFRIFDIWKPFPIRNVETFCKGKGRLVGLGIMLDDLLAGILTALCQIVILRFI